MSISWHKTSKTQDFMNYWCFGSWFILLHQNTSIKSRKSGSISGKNGEILLRNSETQEFRNFGNLRCPLFEFLKFRIPVFLIILENHEKSKTRNLLTLIYPAELLQILEYEFSFDQKHELFFSKTNQLFYFWAR